MPPICLYMKYKAIVLAVFFCLPGLEELFQAAKLIASSFIPYILMYDIIISTHNHNHQWGVKAFLLGDF